MERALLESSGTAAPTGQGGAPLSCRRGQGGPGFSSGEEEPPLRRQPQATQATMQPWATSEDEFFVRILEPPVPYLEMRYANSYFCANGVAPSGHLAVLDGEFSPGTFFSSKSSPPVI